MVQLKGRCFFSPPHQLYPSRHLIPLMHLKLAVELATTYGYGPAWGRLCQVCVAALLWLVIDHHPTWWEVINQLWTKKSILNCWFGIGGNLLASKLSMSLLQKVARGGARLWALHFLCTTNVDRTRWTPSIRGRKGCKLFVATVLERSSQILGVSSRVICVMSSGASEQCRVEDGLMTVITLSWNIRHTRNFHSRP